MELSSTKIKNLIFSEKKAFLKSPKKLLIFQERTFRVRKNLLYFRKRKFLPPRLKNFLYFQKWNFLVLYFSYISGSNFPSSKNKKDPLWKNVLFLATRLKSSYISGWNLQSPKNKQKISSKEISRLL